MKKRTGRRSVDEETRALFRISAGMKAGAERKPERQAEKPPLSLVTGASGRLGNYLVRALLERGERVRVLQRKSGKQADFPKGVEVVYGDLLDRQSLEKAAEDVDYVYHLAALVNPSARFEDLLDVNYRGTRNLLEACRSKAFHLRRFVFVSSISVYGKELAEIPANEETATNPTDNYGKSKMLAEQAVEQYVEKIPFVILRPAVIYGTGFDEAYLPILAALEKRKMSVVGSGKNAIPLIHATDVVRAMLLASRAEKAIGNKYVIATGERLMQSQIFEIACHHLGVRSPGSCTPIWMARLKLRLANLFSALAGKRPKMTEDYIDILASNRIFKIDKAREELGFEPKVRLEDGIAEMVEYYRSKGGG